MSKGLDLFVFSDALGWELAERYKFGSDWLPHRMPCRTLLGYSCTCDPTILTGCQPDEHLHFSFFVKAASGQSPFRRLGLLGWLPHRIAGHHRIRNRVSRWVARRNHYTGYFQLYSVPFARLPWLDYTEKRDIYEPGGILGGQQTFFETWKTSGKRWMRSDWRLGDARNLDRLEAEVDQGGLQLAYLFTAGLDALMHRHGTGGPGVADAFKILDRRLLKIVRRAEQTCGPVRVHVFSDHGMTDVRRSSDLMPRWERLGFRYGSDYVAAWDSTMARFWFHDETVRRRAMDWLAEQPEGRLLDEQELRREHCWFPDQRYGEAFFLLNPGTLFVPSFMNMGFVTGMHGYSPEHPDSTAAFLSNDNSATVHQLKDLFPIMRNAALRT